MQAQRWERVVELYEKASQQEPAFREAFLAEACDGDNELRREVLSLLDQSVTAPGLLESLSVWSTGSRIPGSIGAYRILGVIGEGGMGTVYEAEQQDPRRIVALKVVKAGLAIPEVLRRFKQESTALARLQHPGIAQIYEAGIAGGRPYFVMERVRGSPLLEYAAVHGLSTVQKLELMARICDAAQHAHERGVIHRDLKPANILVDESGQPKVLDFGVARLTDADSQATRGTDLGKLVGTLAYMSPEQILGDPAQVDARSDVYALGLILYELLAGRAPYETGRNASAAMRVICEQDPLPLRNVDGKFRGDLDTIARTALEKDKARRYASAANVASDLRLHLADQPILARSPSAAYLVRKFVRRNRILTGALAGIFLALTAGVVVSAWQASRARRAEQTARAVSEFLENDLLGQASPRAQASPSTTPDPNLRVRTALDRAAARIGERFTGQPEVEAAVRHTIGNTYTELGLYKEALPHIQRALELRRRIFGSQAPETLQTMQALWTVYFSAGDYARAEAGATELFEIRRRTLGERHPDTLGSMSDLAASIVSQGDWARAARLEPELVRMERETLGEQDPTTLVSMNNLASLYVNLGQFGPAVDLYKRVVAARQKVLGENHPSTLQTMNNLAVAYRNLGNYSEAESLLVKVLDSRRRSEGAEHHDTLASMNSLALLYQAQGRYDRSAALLAETLEIARRTLPSHPDTTRFMNNLAEVYWKQGKIEAAERLFREALEGRRKTLAPNHPTTAAVLVSLGEMKLEQKRWRDAEPLLREAIGMFEKSAPGDWRRYHAQAMLGVVLAQTGRRAEAVPLLESSYHALEQKKGAIPAEKRHLISTVQDWYSQFR